MANRVAVDRIGLLAEACSELLPEEFLEYGVAADVSPFNSKERDGSWVFTIYAGSCANGERNSLSVEFESAIGLRAFKKLARRAVRELVADTRLHEKPKRRATHISDAALPQRSETADCPGGDVALYGVGYTCGKCGARGRLVEGRVLHSAPIPPAARTERR